MTECELSSFTFVPLGLWGEATTPGTSQLQISPFLRASSHTRTPDFFVTLPFADICFPSAVAQPYRHCSGASQGCHRAAWVFAA